MTRFASVPESLRETAPGDLHTQARWFVTLWVMAFTFHFFDKQPFDAWAILLAGIPCFVAPGSAAGFAVFLAVSTWVVGLHLPATANHFVLALLVNLAFVACGVWVLLRRSRSDPGDAGNRSSSQLWLDVARTPAGLTLLVVYFFTVFDKLNTSFFDPDVSCAGTQLGKLLRIHGATVSEVAGAVTLGNAVLTMACETAILVALAVPRWLRWGIALGLFFHSGLAAAGFFDFAGFVLALYVLLAPHETLARVRRPERCRRLALAGWVTHAAASFGAKIWESPASPFGPRWRTLQVLTWFLAVLPLLIPFLRACFARHSPPPLRPAWRLAPVAVLALPALAFLNGVTPYLGIKTVANYSMFSNLRTEEARTNHIVPGVGALEMTDFMRDTVDVLAIKFPPDARLGPALRLGGRLYRIRLQTRWTSERFPVRIPWIELRRAALLWKDAGLTGVRVRYARGGVERDVPDAARDAVLAAPLSWWVRTFVAFRAIERGDGPVRCRW